MDQIRWLFCIIYIRSRKYENFRIVAITVDHQLRGEESLEDLRYVENVCKQWKVEFIGKSVDVPSWKKEQKQGTQVAARTLRYAIFEQQMEQLGADYLALGHHGDDQTETMLMQTHSLCRFTSFRRNSSKTSVCRRFYCTTVSLCFKGGYMEILLNPLYYSET